MAAVLAAGARTGGVAGRWAVATAELWRTVLAPLLAGARDVLLVAPSWWPPRTVGLVVRAAEGGLSVRPVSRRELLNPESAFVEIGPEFVVIGDERGITGAKTRCAETAVVVSRVVDRLTDGPVHVDARPGWRARAHWGTSGTATAGERPGGPAVERPPVAGRGTVSRRPAATPLVCPVRILAAAARSA